MAKKEEERSLVVVQDFAIMKSGSESIVAAVKANMEGESLSVFDLDNIHVPAGGGTMWEVPSSDGGVDNVSEIEAIIINSRPSRSFWAEKFEDTGGGAPPDCVSTDLLVGNGTPGGDCETCPNNQWGSGIGGAGKSCKETRLCFLLLPGNILPITLSIPPSSLKKKKGESDGFVNYKLRLASAGVMLQHVTTVFSLEKAKSQSGITYSKIRFKRGQVLTDEQKAMVDGYIKSVKALIGQPMPDGNPFA